MVATVPRRIVTIAVLLLVASSAFGQMDMLPQIFRDLPPELRDGLPEQMSFAEYRALNRNVDFFTMFMSIFIPGYGLFQVERPDLAWPVVGARLAGYGLMGGAVALQWNGFYGFVREQTMSAEDFQLLLVNGFIFGGGVIVAGLSWATDVMLAYHIAKSEKDLVQYSYGIRSSIYGSGRGGTDAASDERYLRRLLEQTGDRKLASQLDHDLTGYARRYPDEQFSGEALFFAALLAAEDDDDVRALRLATRSAYLYPTGPRALDSVRLSVRLLERNTRWDAGYDAAVALTDLPGGEDVPDDERRDARLLEAIRRLSDFEDPILKEAALAEALLFLKEYTASELLTEALGMTADLLLDLGRRRDAAGYLAALAVTGHGSPFWPGYTLRLAELYLGPLGDDARAVVLLRAIVEGAADSEEAARATMLLERQ